MSETLIPAALYARKSADKQLSPSSDTGNQIREIREWATAHGFEIVEEYVDDGIRRDKGLDSRPVCYSRYSVRHS
jgi:DNA invertase Pin-like site-specific DNA recombinase